MSGPRTRSQAAKRKLEEEETVDDDDDVNKFSQQQQQDGATETRKTTQGKQTRLSIANSDNPNHDNNTTANNNPPQQRTRKRQKIDPPIPESEYTEIEYVNQVRQYFAPKNGLAGDLPPIHDLDEIFEKITLNAGRDNGLQQFIKSLNGRKLRVATICSGTESPILALEMIVSRKFLNAHNSFPLIHREEVFVHS